MNQEKLDTIEILLDEVVEYTLLQNGIRRTFLEGITNDIVTTLMGDLEFVETFYRIDNEGSDDAIDNEELLEYVGAGIKKIGF